VESRPFYIAVREDCVSSRNLTQAAGAPAKEVAIAITDTTAFFEKRARCS